MNMFKPTDAKTVEEYMAQLTTERRVILEKIKELVHESAPTLKEVYAYNMPGYGMFNYVDYKKRTVEWPVIAAASQKNYVSVYVCALEGGEYLAEKYQESLGKVSVGKSCIRFKKIEDVNLEILREIFKKAELNPGLLPQADKKQ